MKYTPGPWDIFTDTEDCTVVHIGAPLLPYVATAFGDDPHSITPQQMANAVLLSAAPDLLEALKELRALHWDWSRGTAYVTVEFEKKNNAAIAKARAAINKALGE